MINKMKLFSLLVLLLIGSLVSAQNVEFKASAPSVVAIGEQFRLVYSVNKSGTDLKIPTFEGFDLLMGPSPSQTMSYSNYNGNVTQTTVYGYTYMLEGVKEGIHEIAPATITIDGKQYKSNGVKIQVIKGEGNNSANRRETPQETNSSITDENLFVRVELSRHSLYLGESLMATLKVYSKVDLTNFGRIKFPAFGGFLSEEIPTPQRIELTRETYNGQIYSVGVIRKMLLFPQHTGEITIEPFELECVVRQRLSRSSSPFDDFFGNSQTARAMRRSRPVTVNVKELPQEGKPSGFAGTVGNITMNTSLSADTVNANEAITYKVVFRGTGNLKLLRAPSVQFPLDFEAYDPKESRDVQIGENGMSGTVSFEYLIIPRYSGDYKIPALRFSYFDSQTNSYKTIAGNEYNVFVRKGSEKGQVNANANNGVQSFKKEDVRMVGQDIRYLKTGGLDLKEAGVRFFGTVEYWLALVIPFVLFVIGSILNRRRIKSNADLVRVKNKAANKMARKRLKVAARAMKSHNVEQFYDEVLKSLWGYMSYKLNIDRAELNRENVTDILPKKNVESELIQEFIEVLDICEYARYAPGSDPDQKMEQVYTDSIDVITKLDKAIK